MAMRGTLPDQPQVEEPNQPAPIALPQPPAASTSGEKVLDYGQKRYRNTSDKPPVSGGAFTAGFFLTLVVGAISFFLMFVTAGTASSHREQLTRLEEGLRKDVVELPFVFRPQLDMGAVELLADQMEGQL